MLAQLSSALLLLSFAACEAFVPVSRHAIAFESLSIRTILSKETVWKPAPSFTEFRQMRTSLPAISFSTDVVDTIVSNSLWTYFLQTLIANGVPALFGILVIGFTAIQFRGSRDSAERMDLFNRERSNTPLALLYDDLYGDMDQDPLKEKRRMPFLLPGRDDKFRQLPKNTGVPKQQYLKITNLNQKYDSYQYSLTAAAKSKAAAAAQYRRNAWERAIGRIDGLTPAQEQKLQKLEQDFLQKAAKLQSTSLQYQSELTRNAVDKELQKMGLESVFQIDPVGSHDKNVSNATTASYSSTSGKSLSLSSVSSTGKAMNEWVSAQQQLQKVQMDFVQNVLSTIGPEQAALVRTVLLGAGADLSSLLLSSEERPLTSLLSTASHGKSKLFVTRFPGDTTASQVAELRETVTGIVRSKQVGDECLIVLQTGGGTVTGYGLAAAQLLRLKEAGLKLTIAVEQVAASGGYMMCCVGDKIVASPFAVLGSIGVISELPNVYERLKQEGIEFQTVTAGKYKRTLTPTKKVTKEDFQKTKEDVEAILVLFRDFVAQNRPQLDIDQVATGETWFGTAALERKLCDEIKTVDDVVLEYMDAGFDVLDVEYKPPIPETALGKLLLPASSNRLISSAMQWLARNAIAAVKTELENTNDRWSNDSAVQQRYRAQDDSASRFRSDSNY